MKPGDYVSIVFIILCIVSSLIIFCVLIYNRCFLDTDTDIEYDNILPVNRYKYMDGGVNIKN